MNLVTSLKQDGTTKAYSIAPMSWQEIRSLVKQDWEATDLCIHEALQSDITLINELANHIINSGGKRIRPLLVLLGAAVFGYQGTAHIQLAAIIELIHTATLLHDDVVDSSELRRGQPTANVLWGNQASVLVGDFLYSRTFRMMVQVNNMHVMRTLAEATNTIAAGEVLQLGHCKNPDVTEERYMQVIRYKTGTLFSAAAQLGAIISQRSESEIQNMANFGMHLGTAFQILDDVLDYKGSADHIGKNIGDDLMEGKPTLPLIYAIHNGSEQQANILRNAILHGGCDDISTVREIIESSHAIEYTFQKAQQEAQQAIALLSDVPDSKYKSALLVLAEFVIARDF